MKALALLSGGLDSTLAVRIVLDQGIDVEALKFTSPFCQFDHGGKCFSAEAAHELSIPLKTMYKGEEYLEIVKHPKHGYGKGINPCIDCRIFMLKTGRHFRYNDNKIVVGRNETENDTLTRIKNNTDLMFLMPDHGSPITILQGDKTEDTVRLIYP